MIITNYVNLGQLFHLSMPNQMLLKSYLANK